MMECQAGESLDRLLPAHGRQRYALYELGEAITSTALAEGLTGDDLVRRLLESDLVAAALPGCPEFVAPLRGDIVAVLRDDACIPRLTAMLRDFDKRLWAAMMLGWFGAKARGALPVLVDMAGHSSFSTRAAKEAVVLIGGAEAEIAMALQASAVDLDDGSFRELSDLALMAGYGSAPWLADVVEAAAKSSSEDLREWAPVVMKRIPPEARRRLKPVLAALRNDPVALVRDSASEVPDD